ncbi:MAG TPA: hypothetical protein VGW12_19570 [Pyrinomonadaceae bacterium]|nr:hypothetical protein [Pyrinomonadaceae bacterium]
MGSKGRDVGQKLVAIIVILAMLALMGIPPTVIIFFATVVYFVWRAVDRSEQHETRRIFDFYLAASDVLREDERRWFGFEITEVIGQGESVVHSMADPPPLVHYALGALYNRAGDHEAAAEHLAYILEAEDGDERQRLAPSPELRRYVSVLRRLERDPAEGPQTVAAIRNLERARRTRAASLLEESRRHLAAPAHASTIVHDSVTRNLHTGDARATPAQDAPHRLPLAATTNANTPQSLSPPPKPAPISEVLRDLYEEEKKTA